MLKTAMHIICLALIVGGLTLTPALTSAQGTIPDAKTVDMNTLSRQLLDEVNRLRTNPQELMSRLTAMQQSGKTGVCPAPDIYATFPDGTEGCTSPSYLASAIAQARNMKPLSPLTWVDGLALSPRKYAASRPKGHFDNGTTPGSRAAEFGLAQNGPAESIAWGNPTPVQIVYQLFIDSGVPTLGHRLSMIDPKWNIMGAGCGYPSGLRDWTVCVLHYATGWVDKIDMVKLEVGKQYAFREANNTFRYFKLTSLRGDTFRIDVCPDPPNGGSISGTGTEDLMTPEVAALEGLVAKNKPCDESKVPFGVLNNGTRYPTNATPSSNPPAAATPTTASANPPTATPTAAATVKEIRETVNVEEEQLYAQRLEGNTFQYVKYLWHDNSGYRFGACPNATVLAPITLQTTSSMLTPKTALDNGLTATNEPCPLNPPSYEIGKQYGLAHGPGHVTYIKLLSYTKEANSDTRSYTYSACGSDKEFDLTTKGAFVAVKTIDEVTREGRVTVNKPCANIQNGK